MNQQEYYEEYIQTNEQFVNQLEAITNEIQQKVGKKTMKPVEEDRKEVPVLA